MYRLCLALSLALLGACSGSESPPEAQAVTTTPSATDQLEERCRAAGLVNIGERLPEVIVDLKYSTTDNFLGKDVYGSFSTAWLQPEAAAMLEKAWDTLQARAPQLTFVIYDATRPLSIQELMWATLDMPLEEKGKYLSNPKNGSIHNYGAAVDISLAFKDSGKALDMGTPFDFFGRAAEPVQEAALLAEGLLTQEQLNNRLLLREVMLSTGFRQLPTEWWHYNACSREEAKARYTAIP